MSAGIRLDDALVARGHAASRKEALAHVMAGEVKVDGETCRQASMRVKVDADIGFSAPRRFVSRGGLKLERALDSFGLDVTGLRCLDSGASTGGFTDCLLQRGAAHVCAVDKGYGDFAWKLRGDERVTLFERSDVRDLPQLDCGAPFDLAVSDMSFIPLSSYIPVITTLLREGGSFITLVKPQFEADRLEVGEKGVVRDFEVHVRVIEEACALFRAVGMGIRGVDFSPITGQEGNMEFLLLGTDGAPDVVFDSEDVVRRAHDALGKGNDR
jgi:23S rRNA (cytidine1920-2'-O)/16S rRNA (cytidine1409-2'-O)-methyltransferase